ncbi:MAG: peptidoglycan-binding protein [Myxococcales bacterium]|nr:peptidoglycan-binding protein [Myxococcales bacterium]
MYILRDAFHSYELWDPYASRRVTAEWFPLGTFESLLELARRLARDEDNRRLMVELTAEHGGRAPAPEALAERFAALLHAGRLVLRHTAPCPYPLSEPRAIEPPVELAELADEPVPLHRPGRPEDRPQAERARIEIIVTDDLGAPAAGAQVELRTPSGQGLARVLDDDGRLCLSDLEGPGICTLSLPTIDRLLSPAPPAERTAPPADLRHPSTANTRHGHALRLPTARVHHVIVERPRMHRVETEVLRTRPGSALLVPSPATEQWHPLEAAMTALDRLDAHPEEVLVLVGHRGPDDPPEAAELGHDRAAALHALLVGDRSAWVELAVRSGGYLDVQHLLRYLGSRRRWDGCDPGALDGEDGEASRAAVVVFQATYNERFGARILEDGICGRQTLGALFDVLHDELRRWTIKHGLSLDALRLHPHSPVLDGGLDFPGHPRMPADAGCFVDLLLLDPAALDLARPLAPADLYDHPLATIDVLPVVHEPGDWEHGQLTVVTDLGPAYMEIHEKYRLYADDGSFDIELDTAIEGVLDDGAIELRFEGIPVGPRYALTVTNAADQTFTLFSGLRYDQFHPRAMGEALHEPATPAAA